MSVSAPSKRRALPGPCAASNPLGDASVKPVQRRLLVPLVAVLLLLVGGFLAVLLHMHHEGLTRLSQQVLKDAADELDEGLTEQSDAIHALEDTLLRDADLIDAIKTQDRDRLFAACEEIFTQLRTKHGITHFYLHRPDRVNLLRVHKPKKNGDLIDRFTTLEAERTGQTTSGIELGPLGTFTLRVVRPVFDGGALIGYLELGKEIEDILGNISDEHGVDLSAVIFKRELDRETWETGMQMLGREADWDHNDEKVVIYSSLGHLPDKVGRLYGEGNHTHGDVTNEAEFNGKLWRVMASPLYDAAGVEVGDLLIFHDTTEAVVWFYRVLLMSSGAALVLMIALIGFLYVALYRIDRGILEREAELTSSETFQRTLTETSPDLIFVLGRDMTIRTVNRLQPGNRKGEMVGRSALSLVSPEHQDRLGEAFSQALETRALQSVETSVLQPDGEHFFFNRLRPLPGDSEEHAVVLISTDITGRKKAEQRLRESERGLREAQRLAQVGSWELDLITDTLYWSDEVYNIFGLDPDQFEATYEAFLDAIHPDDRTYVRNAYDDSVRNKTPYDIQHRLLLDDGATLKFVSERCETLYDDTGKAVRSIGTVQDITERKRVEEELRDNSAMLVGALEREKLTTSELESAMSRLKVAATADKLTGLPNREVFVDRLEQAIKRSKRDDSRFAVLFFDFDRFKVINDSLGHNIGDALLCDIAGIFRREVRESDTVARFGGDEFVVLLDCLAEWSDADVKADRLLDALAKPHDISGHRIVSTASIGLVTNERAYKCSGDMIRDADAAMYQAKEAGKARVVVFDQAMHEHALSQLKLEGDLRVALEGGQFRLVYQPIVELNTGVVSGFEALLRWDHPVHGPISPSEFIPIAEDTGLILSIGKWVLRTSARQLADWNQRLGLDRRLTMNVNISKRQLLSSSVLNDALECMREYQLQPRDLELEVTESTIADERCDVVLLLRELRRHGFPIVMDDFGTGVSSLSALHDYPIDVLKIDQSFIRVLDNDRSLLAVVSSITSLAENLGILTVAEGIESQDIVGALQSIECTWGQGYHFAKPLTPADAEAYLMDKCKKKLSA